MTENTIITNLNVTTLTEEEILFLLKFRTANEDEKTAILELIEKLISE